MNLLFPNINLLSLTSFLTFSNIYLLFTHFTHAYTHTHKHTHTHTHGTHPHSLFSLLSTPPKALLCVTPHTHTQSTPVCYSTQSTPVCYSTHTHPKHSCVLLYPKATRLSQVFPSPSQRTRDPERGYMRTQT